MNRYECVISLNAAACSPFHWLLYWRAKFSLCYEATADFDGETLKERCGQWMEATVEVWRLIEQQKDGVKQDSWSAV